VPRIAGGFMAANNYIQKNKIKTIQNATDRR